jgi:hypothetical protein
LNFRAYSTFAERFKKILKIHPGFDQLSEQEQVRFRISEISASLNLIGKVEE